MRNSSKALTKGLTSSTSAQHTTGNFDNKGVASAQSSKLSSGTTDYSTRNFVSIENERQGLVLSLG